MPETTTVNQPAPDPQPTGRTLCRHIRAAGRRCRMAALRGQHFCFYHHAARTPIPRIGVPRYPDQDRDPFALPVLEDRTAIQLALSQVLARIAANDLDPKRAGLLLYGLQIATSALPREPRKPIHPKDEYEDTEDRQENEDTHETDQPDSAESAAEMLDHLEQDPAYGPLAPITPFIPPQPDSEERGLTPFERYLRDTNQALCPQCQTVHAKPKPTPQPEPNPNPEPNPAPDQQTHPEILRILHATADPTPELSLPPEPHAQAAYPQESTGPAHIPVIYSSNAGLGQPAFNTRPTGSCATYPEVNQADGLPHSPRPLVADALPRHLRRARLADQPEGRRPVCLRRVHAA